MSTNLTPEIPSPQPPAPETPGADLKESRERPEAGREKEPQPKPAERPPTEEKQPPDPAPAPAAAPVAPSQPTTPTKDKYHIRVERVLEDGLVDEYLALPPDKRRQFKQEGERVAVRVREMMEQSKVKVKEVLKLILGWLRIIPKPNKWFLEQEAKIKTDRIMALAEEKRNEDQGL
jgi:hypothetical protein